MSEQLKSLISEFKEFYNSLTDEEKQVCACVDFNFEAYEENFVRLLGLEKTEEHCRGMIDSTRKLVNIYREHSAIDPRTAAAVIHKLIQTN